jgi:hypothetical protein
MAEIGSGIVAHGRAAMQATCQRDARPVVRLCAGPDRLQAGGVEDSGGPGKTPHRPISASGPEPARDR